MILLKNRYRFLVLVLGFLCLSSVCSNYILINFTFICMKDDFSDTYQYNGTTRSIYDYTTDEKKLIMWAVAAGTIIGTVPMNLLYIQFGAKSTFLAAGITSAISTALIPMAAKAGIIVLLIIRFIQGLAYSADFAAIGIITVRWAPLSETALFLALLTCFTGISSTITNSATGIICESTLGWRHSFYYHSAACFILFALWTYLYADDPKNSNGVSARELDKILKNKTDFAKNDEVPYKAIFMSPVIWCVWLNAFFEVCTVMLFSAFLPIYFHQVLEYGIAETGFLVGILLGINIPFRIAAAFLSDKLKICSEKLKIQIFNTISVGFAGLLLITVGFFPKDQRTTCVIILNICMICIALNCGGFYKAAALHARQFAHVVISAIQFTKCFSLFVTPAVVAFFVVDDSNRSQWIPVFIVFGAPMIIVSIVSLFFLTDAPAKWTETTESGGKIISSGQQIFEMSLFTNRYRYLILIIGFLCLSSVCSNYILINFTFICMKDDFSDTYQYNGTTRSIYDYTTDEKKLIMWAVAAGTIIGTVPVNMFYIKYGARYPFLLAGIISAASTFCIPYAARTNWIVLLFLRFMQGIAYSADFAAIGLMTVRWAPLSETALFIALLTCFTGISSTITNSVTGIVCESSLGWRYSFYGHSLASIIVFALWTHFYIDDPKDARNVTKKELSKIHKNKSDAHLDSKADIPYKEIFTSPVILCVWMNAFFEMTALILFATYLPIYFNEVLGFGVTETGFYVGLLLGINIPLRLVAALLSDKLKMFTEKAKILFFNTISVGVSGLILISIGFFPKENRMACLFTLFICFHCMAVNCGGFYKSGTLHARQFAHVVIAAIQFTKCLALFAGPGLVALFVSNDSHREQWIPVFASLGAALVLSCVLSLFVFTDEPASWTEPKVYDKVSADETEC
ncbi:unnamed protein product [Caenorhabditis bovis]|uniref:Major facilitator superfamily (MFS) profile domain-containing protein n=1 Tax=Caenorhabditis bovis TaxID=2654633 RepID=A0A8S1E4H7_9PELO|nr:unnamed protein product [Caenorhabditis bovis]